MTVLAPGCIFFALISSSLIFRFKLLPDALDALVVDLSSKVSRSSFSSSSAIDRVLCDCCCCMSGSREMRCRSRSRSSDVWVDDSTACMSRRFGFVKCVDPFLSK
eukprot:5624732-Amphidinium_carterae.1